MKIRLLLLLAVLGVVLVVVLSKEDTPAVVNSTGGDDEGPTTTDAGVNNELKQTLMEIDLPGANPSVTPEIQVQVRPDDTSGQNRLYYSITEKHGFFVETFRIRFVYSPSRFEKKDDDVDVMICLINDFVKTKDTLEGYTQLTPTEMSLINKSLGTSENWKAEVLHFGRWREQDPAAGWLGYKIKKPTG